MNTDGLCLNGMPVHAVRNSADLAAAAARWAGSELLAIDTEFMRVRTYYPKPALYQICDGSACWLIDPLEIGDLGPLAAVLAAPVPKIMHSCSEDLEVMDRHLGVLPRPLVDTQLAAAFCGYGFSVGYQNIVARVLEVALDKSATRTDWLQRPLTAEQVRYAAEDVAWLPALWERLRARLEQGGRLEWLLQECEQQLQRFAARDAAPDPRAAAGAARLDGRGLAILGELLAWREQTARRKDLPRSWVLADADLAQVAARAPRSREECSAALGEGNPAGRRYGAELLQCVEAALALAPAQLPRPLPPRLDARQSARVKALREVVNRRAEEFGIAPELLAKKRDLEELVRCGADAVPDVTPLQGWRRAAVGEALLAELRGSPA